MGREERDSRGMKKYNEQRQRQSQTHSNLQPGESQHCRLSETHSHICRVSSRCSTQFDEIQVYFSDKLQPVSKLPALTRSNKTCQSSARCACEVWSWRPCTMWSNRVWKNPQGFFFWPQAPCLFGFICSFYHPYFSCLQSWSGCHHWDYQHDR